MERRLFEIEFQHFYHQSYYADGIRFIFKKMLKPQHYQMPRHFLLSGLRLLAEEKSTTSYARR